MYRSSFIRWNYVIIFILFSTIPLRIEAFGVIKQLCLASIEAQTALSKSKPNKGLKDYSCNCFIDKIDKGESISSAQSNCKKMAIKKFNL